MNQKLIEDKKNLVRQLMAEDMYVPMKEKELAIFLQVESKDRPVLKQVLQELLKDGAIQITKKGRYLKADNKKIEEGMITGTFISNPRGFGFVEIEGSKEDFFVPEDCVNGAFHKDIVAIKQLPAKSGKRKEAEITAIIEHSIKNVVGTFQKSKSFGFIIPDDGKIQNDIFIPVERSKGAVSGHKVVAEITDYGNSRRKPEGKVIEILGHSNDPGVDILSIVRNYDLEVEFSEKVLNQAARVAKDVSEADMIGRTDLRHVDMVTIDGEDAKDLDDAVSLSAVDGNYHLGVHIADVTNYVQENSSLDKEAVKRGTSVYLTDRVIPMLPHVLSNGICSLNEGVDRLALSCIMTISPKGDVIDYEIAETVINVNRRMTYTAVNKILEEQDETEISRYQDLVPMFLLMKEVSKKLRERRKKRGSIDFDFPESKIILDSNGEPIDIKPYERNTATKLIEDFMLLANETVAQHFYWLELPFVYRTHDKPNPDKVYELATFIRNFGYDIKMSGEEVHPKEIQKLLVKIEDTPEEALISRLALRSMQKALYTVACTGHFGLACQYYCHFTSPIRRYPDLQIHRIIKEQLRGKMSDKRIEHYKSILPQVAKHSSDTEKRADEAQRETDKLKKVQFMEKHIGEQYQGVISGITSWGIYVELPNTVEGMIAVSALEEDYFYYDEAAYEMVGRETGKKFKLGEILQVQVSGVNEMNRTIDFKLAESEQE